MAKLSATQLLQPSPPTEMQRWEDAVERRCYMQPSANLEILKKNPKVCKTTVIIPIPHLHLVLNRDVRSEFSASPVVLRYPQSPHLPCPPRRPYHRHSHCLLPAW